MIRVLAYPAEVRHEPADDCYHVYLRDFPEAVASGETREAALASAADALAAAIEMVLVDGLPWREPSSSQRGDVLVPVSPRLAAEAIACRA